MTFTDIFGTRPAGRGYTPTKSSPAKFRPITRFEKSDPSMRSLYEIQKAEWNAEKNTADSEWEAYVKEMERLYGKDWAKKIGAKKLEEQREKIRKSVSKAAADMRSGKTSSFVGAAAGGIPTFKPQETGGKKAEGPVQVRKAIPQQRAFKAMVEGDPASDRVFATSSEAQAYIKRMGGRGAISSVRGTPEEIEKYQKQSVSGAKREGELKDLYSKRTSEARARSEKLRSAMQDYDEAESPELRATAKARIEEAKRETDVAQKTRGMQPEQKKKFESGLSDIVQKRQQREKQVAEKTATARAESEKQQAGIETKKLAQTIKNRALSRINTLKKAAREASKSRDFGAKSIFESLISRSMSGLPLDERDYDKFFESEAGKEWARRFEEEYNSLYQGNQ